MVQSVTAQAEDVFREPEGLAANTYRRVPGAPRSVLTPRATAGKIATRFGRSAWLLPLPVNLTAAALVEHRAQSTGSLRCTNLRKEGNDLMKAGQKELAIGKYTAALEEDPKNTAALNNRAQVKQRVPGDAEVVCRSSRCRR